MTPDSVGPLSRPVPLGRITPAGIEETVEANPEERAALATDLGLPALRSLTGRFRLTGLADRIRVKGHVLADLDQVCVVTLEPFPTRVDEIVEIEFAPAADPRRRGRPEAEIELSPEDDGPEELLGDSVDLGAIMAEFLALGLDPYPRKPGAAFATEPEPETASPFAALSRLKDQEP